MASPLYSARVIAELGLPQGVKWYVKQDEMFEAACLGAFHVAWDKSETVASKAYAFFPTAQKYSEWLQLHVPQNQRYGYEIIRENLPCRTYLDIEYVVEDIHDDSDRNNHLYEAVDLMRELIVELKERIAEHFMLDDARVVVMNGSRMVKKGLKISYHVIVIDVAFANNTDGGMLALVSDLKCIIAQHVDTKVYTKNRCFRLHACAKRGSPVPLAIDYDLSDPGVGPDDTFLTPDAADARVFVDDLNAFPLFSSAMKKSPKRPLALVAATASDSTKKRRRRSDDSFRDVLQRLLALHYDTETQVLHCIATVNDETKVECRNGSSRMCLAARAVGERDVVHSSNQCFLFLQQITCHQYRVHYRCLSQSCPSNTKKVTIGSLARMDGDSPWMPETCPIEFVFKADRAPPPPASAADDIQVVADAADMLELDTDPDEWYRIATMDQEEINALVPAPKPADVIPTTDIIQLKWTGEKAIAEASLAMAKAEASHCNKIISQQEFIRLQDKAAHFIRDKFRKRSLAIKYTACDDLLELAGRCVRGIKNHRNEMSQVLYSLYKKQSDSAYKRLFIETAVWRPSDSIFLKKKKKEWKRLKRMSSDEILLENEIAFLQICFWEDNPHEEDVELHSYQCVKQLFEETYCQLTKPVGYIRMNADKGEQMQLLTRAYLLDQCGAFYYYGQDQKGNHVKRNFIRCWLNDPKKRLMNSIVSKPLRDNAYDEFNVWPTVLAADLPPIPCPIERKQRCAMIIKHIFTVLASEDKDHCRYILYFMAFLVQCPHLKTNTALLFFGVQGIGKDIIWTFFIERVLGKCLGYQTANLYRDCLSKHSNGLLHRKLILADELDNVKSLDSVLKNIITAETFNYEEKYMPSVPLPNYACFVFTTNKRETLKVSSDDRRMVAFECNSVYKGNTAYFKELSRICFQVPETARAFFDFLMSMDLTGYETPADFEKKRPITEFYKTLVQQCLSPEDRFMSALINRYSPPGLDEDDEDDCNNSDCVFSASFVYAHYKQMTEFDKLIPKTQSIFSREYLHSFPAGMIIVSKKKYGMEYTFDFQAIYSYLSSKNRFDEYSYLQSSDSA